LLPRSRSHTLPIVQSRRCRACSTAQTARIGQARLGRLLPCVDLRLATRVHRLTGQAARGEQCITQFAEHPTRTARSRIEWLRQTSLANLLPKCGKREAHLSGGLPGVEQLEQIELRQNGCIETRGRVALRVFGPALRAVARCGLPCASVSQERGVRGGSPRFLAPPGPVYPERLPSIHMCTAASANSCSARSVVIQSCSYSFGQACGNTSLGPVARGTLGKFSPRVS
jgi:hypothetical protein